MSPTATGTGEAGQGATAGLVAGGAALAASELLTALLSPVPSLVLSVGREVIDRAPPALDDWAIDTFGANDKAVLVAGVVVVSLAIGTVLGAAAVRRFAVAVAGFAAFAAVGVAAALDQASVPVVPTVVAGGLSAAAGLVALQRLLRARPATGGAEEISSDGQAGFGRRRFVRLATAGAGLALVTAVAGRTLSRWLGGGAKPSEVLLPRPVTALPAPPPGTSLEIEDLSPLFTPNRDFYRIDTALIVPRVDLEAWRLRVTGMVDRPFELSFAELLDLPQVESDITMSCVSNEVGGDLVGNARWQGVLLSDLLDRAGVRAGATQIVGRSVDGWTGGFPTEAARGGRGLVAVGMNGEPLPLEHGFPARLVVAGLFGYVSATKWLEEIELTTLEDFDGYWVPRGWSKAGPVVTQSRIDVPRSGARLRSGRQAVAGVAWAPTRGIDRVEVSIDGGPWSAATLAEAVGPASWRQWLYEWDASPGRHRIQVRATDGTGVTQTAEASLPRPSGATGHHTINVDVAEPA